jgi:hypothetical protein
MNRVDSIKPQFVEFIPGNLEDGVLYISKKYATATHLCCCGCGSRVVTPLKAGGWKLTSAGEAVSLYPSIGNWSFPCKSHYWIRTNRIVWARTMSDTEITAVRRSDQLAREQYFNAQPREGFWRRLARRLFS